MRKMQLVFALALGLAAGAGLAQEIPGNGIFVGHGVVKAVAPGTGWLTISQDAIKGFMPAWEMIMVGERKFRAPKWGAGLGSKNDGYLSGS